MLIDRSGGTATYPMKHAALATVTASTYQPDDCPLCKAGSQAIKPGSRTYALPDPARASRSPTALLPS